MADRFSVDDLLSEYNDKIDRFDAGRFAQERRDELEKQARAAQEQPETAQDISAVIEQEEPELESGGEVQ